MGHLSCLLCQGMWQKDLEPVRWWLLSAYVSERGCHPWWCWTVPRETLGSPPPVPMICTVSGLWPLLMPQSHFQRFLEDILQFQASPESLWAQWHHSHICKYPWIPGRARKVWSQCRLYLWTLGKNSSKLFSSILFMGPLQFRELHRWFTDHPLALCQWSANTPNFQPSRAS